MIIFVFSYLLCYPVTGSDLFTIYSYFKRQKIRRRPKADARICLFDLTIREFLHVIVHVLCRYRLEGYPEHVAGLIQRIVCSFVQRFAFNQVNRTHHSGNTLAFRILEYGHGKRTVFYRLAAVHSCVNANDGNG